MEAIEPRKCAFLRSGRGQYRSACSDRFASCSGRAIPDLIDRVCAIAELKGCGVVICINKCDLESGKSLEELYCRVGYPTVQVSAETGEGMEKLYELISGKLSAFTGNSGVGKSSILNRLHPCRWGLKPEPLVKNQWRGRHTTRHVELFRLNERTLVVDTPGFSSFDTAELNLELKKALPETFRDFAPYRDACQFVGCSHTKEKGCAVLRALEEGKIARSRHESYMRLYEELKGLKEWEAKGKEKS